EHKQTTEAQRAQRDSRRPRPHLLAFASVRNYDRHLFCISGACPARSTASGPAEIRHAEQLASGPNFIERTLSSDPPARLKGSAVVNEVTRLLSALEQGDPHAAEELLPLVYDELRTLAAQRLDHEQPGQTLQATDLVHEAYLRLVGGPAA